MQDLPAVFLRCPYCWQSIEVLVDSSVPRQQYVEDCSVCCRPIVITVVASGGEVVSIDGHPEA